MSPKMPIVYPVGVHVKVYLKRRSYCSSVGDKLGNKEYSVVYKYVCMYVCRVEHCN